jgi:hypothetical protein
MNVRGAVWATGLSIAALLSSAAARAQLTTLTLEGWGQTYRPAALANFEARARDYPWVAFEVQLWTGQGPRMDGATGELVVMTARLNEPTGHLDARLGRFVLSTGAVRPVHIDGGSVRVSGAWGTALEAFGGVPVLPRYASRSYDWLVGGRLSQRVGRWGALGASFVERRQHGARTAQEIGADLVAYALRDLSVSGRFSYDLVSRGVSEVQASGSYGSPDRRIELFTSVRNASLILPLTSLFSVLSDAVSLQAGASGRYRVAPRLRVGALAGYRAQGDLAGVRLRFDATLWLDDEGSGAIEGAITRDGVEGQQWTGLRALFYRDVIERLRVMAELELVRSDRDDAALGRIWPWGRVSGRYSFLEHFSISVGAEGSASPQFVRLFQGLVRLAYAQGGP